MDLLLNHLPAFNTGVSLSSASSQNQVLSKYMNMEERIQAQFRFGTSRVID